jgi:hypothetical protein
MLGPALQKLHDDLTGIPHAERNAQQRELLNELSLLSDAEEQIAPVLDQVRGMVDIGKFDFFSITRPARTRPDPGGTSGTKCKQCGRYFPVITQPGP